MDNTKTQSIIYIWLYFVFAPLTIGIILGAIVAKFKPHALKLTLTITTFITILYLIVVFLITKSQQGKPHIAIMVAAVTTVIANTSALISHKITCKLLKNQQVVRK